MKVTIHRNKTGFQIVQEQVNKGKTPPQYENNITAFAPVLNRDVKGTASFKYGIPADLLVEIFEHLLQISHQENRIEFWKKVNQYYSNLMVRVPASGLTLDISTHPLEVDRIVRQADGTYQKTPTIIEFPNSVTDYIAYHVALVHPDVAINKEMLNGHGYYIEDKNIVKQASMEEIKLSKKAQGYYLNAKEEDYGMYLYLLRGLGIQDTQLQVTNLDTLELEEQSIILDRLIKEYPALFIKVYEDEDNKIKYYVELLVHHTLIERRSGEYFYQGNPVASSVEQMMMWLKSPSNNEYRTQLYQNLHIKIKNKSKVNVAELNALLESNIKSTKKAK